jgi:ubiquinone/menaquinone biosynthesis C-methylase UbiE
MARRAWRWTALVAGVLVMGVLVAAGPTLAFHFLPLEWTGEAERLERVLGVKAGMAVADIGAGDGEMAIEIAEAVGPTGIVFATEMTEQKRAEIAGAARDAGVAAVRVVAAEERATGLPAACCEAIYMRNVLHHIEDRATFARDLRRSLKPGGRLAVIDFRPGTFFHLAGSHGVGPDAVVSTLAAAGFRIERTDENWGGGLFLVSAIR